MNKEQKNSRKKRNKIAIVVSVFLLVVGLVILIFVLCKGDASVENMQNELQNAWVEGNDFDDTSFMDTFEINSRFVVTSVEESEENCYIITCDVSSPNILDLLIEYCDNLEKQPTEEEINEEIIKMISSSDVQVTQQTVTAFKTDAGYVFEFSDGFIDAMYGYSYNYCCEQLKNVTNSFNQ